MEISPNRIKQCDSIALQEASDKRSFRLGDYKNDTLLIRVDSRFAYFHNLSKTSDTFSLNVFTGVERE